MAYFPGIGRTVIFGGDSTCGERRNDTWLYDGATWTEVSPPIKPTGRTNIVHSMTYHAGLNKLVLFGGSGGSGFDTWLFDGVTWSQLFTQATPNARDQAMLTYDAQRQVVVLFGGFHADSATWELSSNNWVPNFTASVPLNNRFQGALAYSYALQKVVSFGGRYDDVNNNPSNETWTYDGSNWTRVFPANSPPARAGHAMEYDAGLGKIIIHGGYNASYAALSDTWAFDGVTWQQVDSIPLAPVPNQTSMAYDAGRGKHVTFSGIQFPCSASSAGTWELTLASPVPPMPVGTPVPPIASDPGSVNGSGDTVQVLSTKYKLDGSYPSNLPQSWLAGYPLLPKPDANRIIVGVKWGGDQPGRIDVRRSGVLIASYPAGQTTELQLNMLSSLPANGPAPLEIQAFDAQNALHGRKVFAGRSYALQSELLQLVPASLVQQNRTLIYDALERSAIFEIDLTFPPESLASMIDFLGEDSRFGWKDLQLVGKVSLALGGDELEVAVGAKATKNTDQRRTRYFNGQVRLGKSELTLEPELGAVARITDQGARFVRVKGSVVIAVNFTDKYGPVKLLVLVLNLVAPPAGTTLLSNPVTGPALSAIDGVVADYAHAYTKLTGKVGGEAEYDIEVGQLVALSLIGGLGVEFGVKAEIPDAGISVGAALGGEATAKFRIAPQPCQSIELAGYARAWAYIVVFNNEWEGRVQHEYTNCPTLTLNGETAIASDPFAQNKLASPWHLVGGGYRGPYSLDRAAQAGDRMARPAAGEPPSAQPLVTNVYTNTMPTFAPLGIGNGLAVWAHDTITRPLGQNLDIAYATLSNGAWSTTKRVTDDTFLDSAPTAGGVGNTVVAAWMRLNDPALPADTTLDVTVTKKVDIASAVYVSATQSWSAISVVGKPDSFDHSPVVAATADGTGRVAWLQNDEGLFTGINQIMVSRVTSAGIEAPAVVISGVADISQLTMAASADGDTLAFVRTISHTNGISNTSSIYVTRQVSGTWGAPVATTPVDQTATSAHLVYLSDGSLVLVYRLAGHLIVQSVDTGLGIAGPIVDDGGFSVAAMPDNGLSSVFSHSRDGQFDLYASYFDGNASVWSEPLRLTQDRSLELWPTAISAGPASLSAVYARTAMVSTTTAITGMNGLSTTVSYLSRGQTDLFQLAFTYARNVGIASLTAATATVSAGQAMTVTAVITNSGQLPVRDFAVSLSRNGVEVTRTTVTSWVAGGDRITVELPFMPASGMPMSTFSVTVDADNQLAETLKVDNVATFAALGPDLSLDSLFADIPGGRVLAQIRNTGLYSTPQTSIGMWISDGAKITVTSAWLLPLAPGAEMIVALPITSSLTSAQILTATLEVNPNGFSFPEVNGANNTAVTKLGGMSYLAFASSPAPVPESGHVTVTVRNFGATASGLFTVSVYLAPTLEVTELLEISPQSGLGAGAERLVPLSIPPSDQCATFARISALSSETATVAGNLLILTRQRQECVVFTSLVSLPLVLR